MRFCGIAANKSAVSIRSCDCDLKPVWLIRIKYFPIRGKHCYPKVKYWLHLPWNKLIPSVSGSWISDLFSFVIILMYNSSPCSRLPHSGQQQLLQQQPISGVGHHKYVQLLLSCELKLEKSLPLLKKNRPLNHLLPPFTIHDMVEESVEGPVSLYKVRLDLVVTLGFGRLGLENHMYPTHKYLFVKIDDMGTCLSLAHQ